MIELEGYSNLVKIGEGGMAHVYRGIQKSLQRPVAIKLLINDLSSDDEARHRFERESYIVARMNHANVVHVIDRGITADDMPYFVMEYIEGTDLGTAIKTHALSHNDKIDIVIQLLKALSYAHKNNVIHRDIKPENVLIDDDGNVKVLDFGIAQFYDEQGKTVERTSTGMVMGTYSYMSPEQRESADNVTARSDLYSVGVVMYKLFTEKLPTGVFPPPQNLNPELSPEIGKLIMCCLDTSPEKRPASAEQMKNELLAAAQGAHLNTEIKARVEQGVTRFKSRFLLLDVLREDKFGGVFLYQQKEKGSLLVIKRKRSDSSGFEASNLLASLAHPNIVSTFATIRTDGHFMLVQEYMSGGTLQDKLAFQLNWQQTLKIAIQLCEALIFAHNNRIVHGHLRPTNILFNNAGDLKVTDFALIDDTSEVELAHFYALEGEARSVSADIYAAGVILYQLFTGCLPRRRHETGFHVRKVFSRLPEDIREQITKMLSTIPENRDENSLHRIVEVLRQHQERKHNKPFTEIPHHDKNRELGRRREGDRKNRQESAPPELALSQPTPRNQGRMVLLFAILVLVFANYLLLFDGQEKINHSMPHFYSAVLDGIEGLTGSNDARGVNQIENRRLY